MHELAVTQNIIDIVVSEADKLKAAKVTAVKIKMGMCTCLVPQLVQDYFDLFTEDTVAQGARVVIERVPGEVECNDCGNKSIIKDFRVICPICNGRNTKLIHGKEFYIESMEIEDE